ncbi:hypothetical protein T09_11061 [Trichinella sp. T9]|nr:hypothetical protein T09_11061 [Trichinella sp. T9]KRZ92795.1 hypothetical protein T08_2767 [Trichinella sp. T8]
MNVFAIRTAIGWMTDFVKNMKSENFAISSSSSIGYFMVVAMKNFLNSNLRENFLKNTNPIYPPCTYVYIAISFEQKANLLQLS